MVHVKVFPENILFSGKENVFMCLVAFQKMFRKIFSDVWLCSWKYHRKHIFYLLLTFSHIFSVTKRIYNIIHSSKHKQNLEKNHKIRTNEGKIAIAIGVVGTSRNRRGVGDVASLLSFSLFYFPRSEVIWSENENINDFPLFWLSFSVNWKCFSIWPNLK